MSKKQGLTSLLIIALIFSSCSLTRKAESIRVIDINRTDSKDIIRASHRQNIAGKDLTISKVKIEYRSENLNRSVNAFIKQNEENDLLVSLRSFAGIEIARIFINNDSLKVYDRLNSILYVQSVSYIGQNYGIIKEDLKFLFGDIPDKFVNRNSEIQTEENFEYRVRNKTTEYKLLVDSLTLKLKKIIIGNDDQPVSIITYKNFVQEESMVYPKNIHLNMNGGEIIVDMSFAGVKQEKIKNMKFYVGNRTEVIVLK